MQSRYRKAGWAEGIARGPLFQEEIPGDQHIVFGLYQSREAVLRKAQDCQAPELMLVGQAGVLEALVALEALMLLLSRTVVFEVVQDGSFIKAEFNSKMLASYLPFAVLDSMFWSHKRCVHILRDEGHLLSEQQFVDCSKQSSGCNDGLMHAAFTSYKMKAIASLRGSLSRWSGWSHKRCVHILQDEDHRLSEHRFVDCSKQSRGCHGGLMDAAFTFYKMKAIASLRSSPLIAPSGAVAATVISWTPRSHYTS